MYVRLPALPSAQMLLLHFIYGGTKDLLFSWVAKNIFLMQISVSRAAWQLEEMGLINIRKSGVQKILVSESSPEALFTNVKKVLVNPVKRTIYVSENDITSGLMESGYFALAEYSMLSVPIVKCFASAKISQWKEISTN